MGGAQPSVSAHLAGRHHQGWSGGVARGKQR
jgi:hypothetical protein